MKHNYTIGFDARSANSENSEIGCYGRFIIKALAEACPENAYFRMYTPKHQPQREYDALDSLPNVESMEPDGAIWRKLSLLWQMFRMSKDAKRGDVELYHGLEGRLPYGLRRRGIRSVVSVHNLISLRFTKYYNIFERVIEYIRLSSACHRADRIIAASEATRRDIAHLLGVSHEKIDVVYEGCNPLYSREISDEEVAAVRKKYDLPERYILNIGDMVERKNFGLIVEAMAELPDDINLVVVGEQTSYTKRVKRRLKVLGFENRVHFRRNVATQDRAALYKGADIFINPSRFEGFSVEILEALSVGVPVIATRGSSLEEAGGKHSIYVSDRDCGELVEAIERLSSDEQLREKMIEEGKHHVTHFRSEVAAYNIMKCYLRIGIDLTE
ncbi:MAG: glycosyltransferase family 4 protein [Alistipes sp.]|nr:glycosyltransferase family 4 protein [Alistipes sp.]